MMAQYVFLGTELKRPVVLAVSMMIFGSLVAAANDLTFDAVGYLYVMCNNMMTTACQILTKQFLNKEWTKTTIIFWTAALNVCISSIDLMHFDPSSFCAWDQSAFQLAFFFSVILGFVINWSIAWTIEKNDALTLAVAGSSKSALMGLLVCAGLFDMTYKFSMWNFVGLQISAAASFLYAYIVNKKTPVPPTPKTPPV